MFIRRPPRQSTVTPQYTYDWMGFGQPGFDRLSGSGIFTPTSGSKWVALKAYNQNAVVAQLTSSVEFMSTTASSGTSSNTYLTSVTIQQGDVFYGPFTTVSMSSGQLLGYRDLYEFTV
jgi:hypothetical protein